MFEFQSSVRFPALCISACVCVCCWQDVRVLFERQHQFAGRLLFYQCPVGRSFLV